MLKYIIVISLLIGPVGFSQNIIHTETYDNGVISSITYHQKVFYRGNNAIVPVKIEEYRKKGGLYSVTILNKKPPYLAYSSISTWYENGQKRTVEKYKDGERVGKECWDKEGSECECWYQSDYGCK